jgi:hypothetical protein
MRSRTPREVSRLHRRLLTSGRFDLRATQGGGLYSRPGGTGGRRSRCPVMASNDDAMAEADARVRRAREAFVSQQEIVASLEIRDCDVRLARTLLRTYEVELQLLIEERERLQATPTSIEEILKSLG